MSTRIRSLGLVIIALVYSVGATGMAFQAHFCKGEFYSIKIATEVKTPACGCSKKSGQESCCKDVIGYFNIEDDHSAGSGYNLPVCLFSVSDLSPVPFLIPDVSGTGSQFDRPEDDPPDLYSLPLYLLVHNLRN